MPMHIRGIVCRTHANITTELPLSVHLTEYKKLLRNAAEDAHKRLFAV